MSNTLNYQKLAPSALPLIVLAAAVGAAVYFAMQSPPLPPPRPIILHPAITRLPIGELKIRTENQKQLAGHDVFFRSKAILPPEADIPLINSPAHVAEVHLTSIAGGTAGKYCIVNSTFFLEGEKGDTFTVQNIAPDHVTFTAGETTFTLVPGEKYILEKITTPGRDSKE